jgi:hypothetical protein
VRWRGLTWIGRYFDLGPSQEIGLDDSDDSFAYLESDGYTSGQVSSNGNQRLTLDVGDQSGRSLPQNHVFDGYDGGTATSQ